jgi:hypothetical protein
MMAVHQETTPDLSPDTLTALSQLMLAQAQEVIAYKCIKGMYTHTNNSNNGIKTLTYLK